MPSTSRPLSESPDPYIARMILRAALLMLPASVLFGSTPALAQVRFESHPSREQMLLGNILLGGVSAGAGALISGHKVLPALVKGVAGGAVAYAGKEIIAREGTVAAWTGRQVGAVGSSVVMNAVRGRSPLDEIVLPLGLVRLYVSPQKRVVQPRLDLAGILAFGLVAVRKNTSFDMSASLSSGALVFSQNPRFDEAPGVHRAGVLRIDNLPDVTSSGDEFTTAGVTTHELIHAAQYDFVSIAWSVPVERALLGRSETGRKVSKYLDLGLIVPLWGFANGLTPPRDRPWEREANALAPGG
jgi:hypothetical protein